MDGVVLEARLGALAAAGWALGNGLPGKPEAPQKLEEPPGEWFYIEPGVLPSSCAASMPRHIPRVPLPFPFRPWPLKAHANIHEAHGFWGSAMVLSTCLLLRHLHMGLIYIRGKIPRGVKQIILRSQFANVATHRRRHRPQVFLIGLKAFSKRIR